MSINTKAMTATLEVLLAPGGLVAAYMDPIPSPRRFARWLKQAGVPKLKPNPAARRGGGTPYFHVATVERILRQRSGNCEAA